MIRSKGLTRAIEARDWVRAIQIANQLLAKSNSLRYVDALEARSAAHEALGRPPHALVDALTATALCRGWRCEPPPALAVRIGALLVPGGPADAEVPEDAWRWLREHNHERQAFLDVVRAIATLPGARTDHLLFRLASLEESLTDGDRERAAEAAREVVRSRPDSAVATWLLDRAAPGDPEAHRAALRSVLALASTENDFDRWARVARAETSSSHFDPRWVEADLLRSLPAAEGLAARVERLLGPSLGGDTAGREWSKLLRELEHLGDDDLPKLTQKLGLEPVDVADRSAIASALAERVLATIATRPLDDVGLIALVQDCLPRVPTQRLGGLLDSAARAWGLGSRGDVVELAARLEERALVLRIAQANEEEGAGYRPPCSTEDLARMEAELAIELPRWYRFLATRIFDGRPEGQDDWAGGRLCFHSHRELAVRDFQSEPWAWTRDVARAREHLASAPSLLERSSAPEGDVDASELTPGSLAGVLALGGFFEDSNHQPMVELFVVCRGRFEGHLLVLTLDVPDLVPVSYAVCDDALSYLGFGAALPPHLAQPGG